MKNLVIAIVAVVFLASCSTIRTYQVDTEVFRSDRKTYTVYYGTPEGITEYCSDRLKKKNGRQTKATACAHWNMKKETCEIWVPEVHGVEDRKKMASAGHEVWHCVKGGYHERPL